MTSLVIILTLITVDPWQGIELARASETWQAYVPAYGDRRAHIAAAIEGCRVHGVAQARKASKTWRGAGVPYASTNLNCDWHHGAQF